MDNNKLSKISRPIVYLILLTLVWICCYNLGQIRKQQFCEKQKNENSLDKINHEIIATRYRIDSVRHALPGAVLDSMMRNDVCAYLMQNAQRTDSLRHVNDSLLTRAFNIANKKTIFSVPHRNTTLFTEFSDLPEVRRIGWKYYANDRQIRKYNKTKAENPYLARAIRTHFDSVANTQISQLQRQMDSLLNVKHAQIENLMSYQK